MSAPVIDLSHGGTPPVAWREVVRGMRPWRLDPARHRRVIVVAPHPDDETLGVGGVIAEAARRRIPVVVVSATDGEASSEQSGLGDRRHDELLASLSCLVPAGARVIRCGLPDGGLADHRDELAAVLAAEIQSGDLVLAPLYCDGHPDHDAAGSVVAALGGDGADVCFFPIWAWHWHEPSVSVLAISGRRVDLSPAASSAKARALKSFDSQTTSDDPVLPAHFLGRFDVPYEVLVQLTGPMSQRVGGSRR